MTLQNIKLENNRKRERIYLEQQKSASILITLFQTMDLLLFYLLNQPYLKRNLP